MLNSPETIATVLLSLKVGLAATAVNLPAALGASCLLSRCPQKGRFLLDGLLNLPLVMPPVTTGFLLLLFLGKHGPVGSLIYRYLGIRIAFTTGAAIIAAMVVSFPLVTRSIRVAMDMVDGKLGEAALTLGAGKTAVFFRITLPLILPGIISGVILGFARSLGEFGATITFAGNISGETRTLPLAVYSFLQVPGMEKEAIFLVVLSIIISFSAMLVSSVINRIYSRRILQNSGG